MKLTIKDNGSIIASRLIIADSFTTRFKGLMGTRELKDGHGLLITPCNSIHMLFMRYGLDLVFLNRNYKVVRLISGIKPWRISPVVVGAYMVVELPVGTIDKYGIKLGDLLEAINTD